MGTRSACIIFDNIINPDWEEIKSLRESGGEFDLFNPPLKKERVELMRYYRHWDGYPEGHGHDIAIAMMMTATTKDGLNNRNWCQQLLKNLMVADMDVEFEPIGTEHGDLEYLYAIDLVTDNSGGKHCVDAFDCATNLKLAVYSIGWDMPYEEAMSKEPLFSGTYMEYFDWLEDRR